MGELRERHVESGNSPSSEEEQTALVITPRRADRGKDAWLFLAASTVIVTQGSHSHLGCSRTTIAPTNPSPVQPISLPSAQRLL
jgi:hypothetical protein